jgi:hypothetical protein
VDRAAHLLLLARARPAAKESQSAHQAQNVDCSGPVKELAE